MNRISLLQRKLIQEKLSAFLVTNPYNIYYLSGFRGLAPEERELLLLIDREAANLYVPRMYRAEAQKAKTVKVHILPERTKLFEVPLRQLARYRGKIGFEAEDLKYIEHQVLKKKINRLVGKKNFVSDLRIVKEKKELVFIKKAVRIADQTFEKILKYIRPGITEKQIARKIIEIMEDLGAEGPSFAPIVASGTGSALPHYATSNKRIHKNEPVLLDFGAKVSGYCSDLTRVVYMGRAPQEFRKHYELVLAAQEAVIRAARPGLETQKLHQIALASLGNSAGFMLHGVGHGIGLEVHEKPFLRTGIKDKLKEGMAVTIEPGLYYEGKYGIRIEDYGVVTKSGLQVLSKAPKELIEI